MKGIDSIIKARAKDKDKKEAKRRALKDKRDSKVYKLMPKSMKSTLYPEAYNQEQHEKNEKMKKLKKKFGGQFSQREAEQHMKDNKK